MIVSDIKELIGKTPIFQFLATDYGGERKPDLCEIRILKPWR